MAFWTDRGGTFFPTAVEESPDFLGVFRARGEREAALEVNGVEGVRREMKLDSFFKSMLGIF
jgi:hypothetical protein